MKSVLAALDILGIRTTFLSDQKSQKTVASAAANSTLSHWSAIIHEQSATSFHSSDRALSEDRGSVSGTVERTSRDLGAAGSLAAPESAESSQDLTYGTSDDDERNASILETNSEAPMRRETAYESSEKASDPSERDFSGGRDQRSATLRKRSNEPR